MLSCSQCDGFREITVPSDQVCWTFVLHLWDEINAKFLNQECVFGKQQWLQWESMDFIIRLQGPFLPALYRPWGPLLHITSTPWATVNLNQKFSSNDHAFISQSLLMCWGTRIFLLLGLWLCNLIYKLLELQLVSGASILSGYLALKL